MGDTTGQIVIAALMPHAPILVPAVGGERGHEANASIRAMAKAARRVVAARPETLVLISPHSPRRPRAFAVWAGDRISGSLGQFGAPEAAVDLPADEIFADLLIHEARSLGLDLWWLRDVELDHGATVPLWHLTDAGWRGNTVVLGLNYPGEPGLVELGKAIKAVVDHTGRRLAVMASGDMSHRLKPGAPAGFHPRAREFDHEFIECLRAGNYRRLLHLNSELQKLAAEDAADSTTIAAAAVNWNAAGHEVLSYEGPFGVGYGVAILHRSEPEDVSAGVHEICAGRTGAVEGGQELPQLARRSIEAAFRGEAEGPILAADGVLGERHGVFVTIRGPRGKLRGCVGTLKPRCENTVAETWWVARDAAFRDGRFAAVSPRELKDLNFEVSLVFPPEEVVSPTELNPQRYGVVVTTPDGRRGVLLPDIPGVDTVERQLEIARNKGGIAEDEPVRLQRFIVKKFSEGHRN